MSVFRRGAHSRRRFCVSRDQRNNPNSYKRSAFSGLKTTDFSRGRGAHKRANDAARVLSKKNNPAFIGAVFAVLLLLIVALPQAYAAIGDAVAPRAVSDHTVSGVSPRGTTINVFDYWITGQDDPDNVTQSLRDQTTNQLNERYTQGINANHTLKFGAGMGTSENNNENLLNSNDINYWTGDAAPRQSIVSDELVNGYPELSGVNGIGTESLSYLFDGSSQTGKAAYMDVDGLLRVDDQGYYYYNSQDNFAQFNSDGNGSGSFTLYNRWGVEAAGSSPDGQFFPFNTGDEVFDERNGQLVEQQINTSQGHRDLISTDEVINHYFGLNMSTRFIQQNGGYTAPDGTQGRQEVTYNFSGDDDVWIYIDGVLVGDLGGIHDKTSIEINFVSGEVIVYDDQDNNNEYNSDRDGAPYRQTTLYALFESALGDDFNAAAFSGDTFADDTYHTLDFFYLERGNTDSNMSLKYNLVNIPESGIVKVDQYGDELAGVQFTLSEANSSYQAADNNNDGVVTQVSGRTDSNGEMIFTYENSSDQEMPITLEQMGDRSGYWILKETEGNETVGYRNPGTVELRFSTINDDGTGDGVLLSSNQWETGAYSQAHVTATAPTNVTDVEGRTYESAGGLMFAVVAQIDEQGNYHAVTGDAFAGWSVADATINNASTSKDAIVTATKAAGYQFLLGSGGAYQVTIDDLPGDINTYEYMIEQAGGDTGTAQYAVKYYWSDATSIDDLSSNNQIVEIDPDAEDSFERIFSVTLSIPNIKNELSLVKSDETTGDPIASVEFKMYEDENGDGTYNEGENLYFTGTTNNDGRLEITSSTNNGEQVLAKGEYVLVETVPGGYVDEQTSVRVIVDDDGVHVDAGDADDNVTVETGIGSLVYSMRGFAAGDDVDSTLHDVVAQAQTTGSYEGSSTVWGNAAADKTHYQYDDQTDGLNYVRNESATDNGDATFTADAGWSRLDLRQCMTHEGEDPIENKQNLGDQSLNALFTGDVTIHVTNSRIPTDTTLSGAENLQVTKNLVGTEWGTDWTFSFTIAPYDEATKQAVEDGIITMPDPAEISIGSDNVNVDGVHQAAFGDIAFSEAGTYHFVVTENDLTEGIEGVTKDASQKIVTVEVAEGDNGLVATLDDQSDDLTFTNTADLTINGASALQVTKNLHASADTVGLVQADEGTYNFTVTAQNTEGEGQPTAAEAAAKLGLTDGDGAIDTTREFSNDDALIQGTDSYVWSDTMNPLPNLTFTAADRGKTFTYVVDEVEPDSVPAGYVFDGSTHTVTYTVSGNTAAALSVVVSVDGNQVNTDATPSVTFDNRIQAGTIGGDGADTALAVEKITNVDTEVDFSFDLTLVNSDGTPIKSDYVYELDQDGNPVSFDGMSTSIASAFNEDNSRTQKAIFGQIIFTQPGTYTFQVSEVVPENANGWSYADSQTITVTVNDDYSVSINPENATVTFKNTYGATGSLALDGLTKALEGRDWMEDDEFTFTLSGKNVTEGTNATSGFTLPETTEVTVDYDDAVAAAGEGNATEGVKVPFSFGTISFTQAGTYEFTVTESEIEEAGVSNTSGNVTYRVEVADESQDGNLEITSSIIGQTGSSDFVNTYEPKNATSSLMATKTLNGSSKGLEAGAFTFQIKSISAPHGSTANLPTGVTSGDDATVGTVTNDANGVISFGQFLFDAEGEYVYKVTEIDEKKGGYTYDDATYTVVFTVSDNPETGSLVATSTIYQGKDTTGAIVDAITFANGYQPESVTTPTNATFSGTKSVTEEHGGFTLEAGQFSFTMTSTSAPDGVGAPAPSNGSTVSNAEDGSFDFGTLTFVEPGEYTYTVTEDKPAQGIDGITYSSEVYTLYFNVVDNNGQLEIKTQSITNSANETVDAGDLNFTNIYNDGEVSYQIAGTKVLETNGYSGETLAQDEYSFALYEEGAEEPLQTVTNGAPNGNAAAFQFDSITYAEAGTHTYKVYELGTDGEPGTGGIDTDNVSYSEEVYTITVIVSESNDGRGLSVSSDVQNSDIVFTNTYTPESVVVGPNGDAQIGGTKELDAAEGTDRTLKEGEFTFALLDGDGNEVSSTTNAADGSFVFDDLTFDKTGTYSYTVAEKSGNAGGITYDETLYGVTITVTEDTDTNKLVAQVSYSKGNQSVEAMSFTNTYEAIPIGIQLGASKELQNASLAAGQFTFELTGSEGAPMPESTTTTNTENGQVLFGEIAFDTVGEYDYTITEVNDGQEGITYDADATRTIHVSVTDRGEGFLGATVSYGEDGSHFVNIGTPDDSSNGGDPGDGGNTNGGSSDEGPLESLAQTSDTWLPALFAVIAAMATAVGGFAAYRMKRSNGRR